MLRYFTAFVLAGGILFFSSCQEEKGKDDTSNADITEYKDDASSAGVIQLDGELFSIPSPIQSAIFIKENGSRFRDDLLVDPNELDGFQTGSQKAMGLGIFGAELGYVSLYDENDKALSYMNTTRKLADDIGISGAFDETLVHRFSDNVGVADSMIVLVSDIYEASDAYLKSNERNDMSALILFGGWIESLYITCKEVGQGNPAIRKRVAEQKAGFHRLSTLIRKYHDNSSVQEMEEALAALDEAYGKIESKYVYKRPEVHLGEQKTILKGEVLHQMDDETLSSIISSVEAIRNQIIGAK